MKKFLFLAVCLLHSALLLSQNEEQLIKNALNYYIVGTSYNDPGMIQKAFYKDANLYLTNRENKNWVVSSKEYISWYKEENKGKYTGREGKILSIDRDGMIALAKVEIFFAKSKTRYIDNFIMKKVEGEWKIMSKSANKVPSNQTGKKVLMVLSNSNRYGDSEYYAGNSYPEIIYAYEEFKKSGYSVDFVSQHGGEVPVVYAHLKDSISNAYFLNTDFIYQLKNTYKPKDIKAENYDAIYYVGGSAVMYGIHDNNEIQKIAMAIYEENKGVIAAVCHGTAGIINLKDKKGKFLVKGKKVSGYPDSFENKELPSFKYYPFLIQKTIEKRGGKFKHADRREVYVEVDGRLVTGQNYQSTTEVAKNIIRVLAIQKDDSK